jgi:hypothetical protein
MFPLIKVAKRKIDMLFVRGDGVILVRIRCFYMVLANSRILNTDRFRHHHGPKQLMCCLIDAFYLVEVTGVRAYLPRLLDSSDGMQDS